jgi:Flp pilus assembly protein TadG
MVELTLFLPVLIVIVMGAVDFGRVFFAYTTLVNAAREGAMCASLGAACPTGYLGAVQDELAGTLAGVTATVSPNPVGASGTTVTVTVQHNFEAITAAILAERTFPLSASATMVVQ